MLLGAGVALAVVLGGWWIAQLAFRGPDVFATRLVVGGFIVRVVLLILALFVLVAVGHVELLLRPDPGRGLDARPGESEDLRKGSNR